MEFSSKTSINYFSAGGLLKNTVSLGNNGSNENDQGREIGYVDDELLDRNAQLKVSEVNFSDKSKNQSFDGKRNKENSDLFLDNKNRKKWTRFMDKMFTCDICDITFTRLPNLANHAFGFHHPRAKANQQKIIYKMNDSSVSRSKLLLSKKQAHLSRKKNKCRECGKMFKSKPRLREHFLIAHEITPVYICKHCGMVFTSPGSLRTHVRDDHEDTDCPYEDCRHANSNCSKDFRAHIRSKHIFDGPLKCLYCDKAFVRRNDLRIHENTHSSEEKYKCDNCGSNFRREESLRRHRLRCMALAIPRIRNPRADSNIFPESKEEMDLCESDEEHSVDEDSVCEFDCNEFLDEEEDSLIPIIQRHSR